MMQARLFKEPKLLVASHNVGKVREIKFLLESKDVTGIEILSAHDLNLEEPEETGTTFHENAALKARAACAASGLPSLADDSGLCVNALGGDPGIYSARWAGKDKDFSVAMQKINDNLGDNPDRSAYFVCVLALCWPDGEIAYFEGRINGTILWPPRGENGFGYDPFFQPVNDSRVFGEMSFDEKNTTNH
ncbi:MAG: RdgB/HAM1 family non-canonical purine NTP pyrophosphatase, partial [Alphaproteobacteria bacterium]